MSLVRYSLVGAAATLVHYGVLALGVEAAGWPAGAASALGAVAGAGVAYVGNRRLTFATATTSHRRALPRFLGIATIGALGNGLIVTAGTGGGWHYLAAQGVATGVMVVLTYHLNRRWTFS